MLYIDGYCKFARQFVNLFKLGTLYCILMALPTVTNINWVGMDHLELGLNDAFWLFVI